LLALRVDVISSSAEAIKHVANAIRDGANDTIGDAVDDTLDVRGWLGVGEDVACCLQNVLNVAPYIARLVVEEAGEGL
jgi:hypothetical protein